MDCSKNLIRKEQIIQLVQRQTDYDRETIIKKLETWDNNYLYVIKEYMNPDFNKKKEEKKHSNNQMVFSEIRSFMDTANRQYLQRKKQEKFQKERQQQLYMKYLKQKREYEKQKKNSLETITENKIIDKIIDKVI